MSRPRLITWTIAILAAVAVVAYRTTVFFEPPRGPAPKVAFITGGSGPYWQLATQGAESAAADYQVELQVEMPEDSENLQQQMAILEQLNLTQLDGIAISPIDAEGQTQLINGLVRRNKKVVTFDSDAPLSTRQSYVGTSNVAAGGTCALLVTDALPEGGKVAVLLANLTKENLRDRQQGFQDRMAQLANEADEGNSHTYEIVGFFTDNGSAEKCSENIRRVLDLHPNIACIVGMNARHGPILLEQLNEAGKLGDVTLITFDDAPETLAGIEAGHIYATVAQDPYKYGYEAVNTLASLCRGNKTSVPIVGKGSTYVNAEPIRQDNLDEFRARQSARRSSGRIGQLPGTGEL